MVSLMFSPAKASAITGIPVKIVQKAIDTGAIPECSTDRHRRYVSNAGLICLKLQANGLSKLPLALRKTIFREVCRQPRARAIRLGGGAMMIELSGARRELAAGLMELRRAEQIVDCNPNILGGIPVFRGTRVPVHLIADMANSGVPVSEILENYPSLNEDQVTLSAVYAKAYPKRGRPPVQPWSEKRVLRRTRRLIKPCRLEASNG